MKVATIAKKRDNGQRDLRPARNTAKATAATMTRMPTGSWMVGGIVVTVQIVPQPPGQPLAAGGQEYVPPVGQGGGVQTTVTLAIGVVGTVQTVPQPPGQPSACRGTGVCTPGRAERGVCRRPLAHCPGKLYRVRDQRLLQMQGQRYQGEGTDTEELPV